MSPTTARRTAFVLGALGVLLAGGALLIDLDDRSGQRTSGQSYETQLDTFIAGGIGVVLIVVAVLVLVIGTGVSLAQPQGAQQSGTAKETGPRPSVVVHDLREITDLRERGALSEQEFADLKAELIRRARRGQGSDSGQ